MENIKRYTISLLLVFAVILNCGCQSTDDIPKISDSGISSTPQENVTNNNEVITTVTESEIVTTPAVITEKNYEPIPSEWIYIDDSMDVLTHFNTIVNADCSEGEMSDIIRSLVHKNVLFYLTQLYKTFEGDWDNPITYGDDEITLYLAVSVFFPDVKSIYDLARSIYGDSADNIYTYDPSANSFYLSYDNESRLFFMEIDGKMYVSSDCIPTKGGPRSFTAPSYIEITEQTEDMCKLTWHYPDVEGLNEPDKYPDYYYYEGHFTARYIDGAWRLDRVIGY